MTSCAATSVPLEANAANPLPGSWTVNRSRLPRKGVRGFDAHKQVKGRKRHILVDTLGLILAVVVTAASVQDRDGAKNLLEIRRHKCSRLRLIWAEQAYSGQLIAWVKAGRGHRPIR